MAVVCSCAHVTDRRISRAIEHGAATLDDVAEACGAGAGCGTCSPAILELLAERETPVALPGGLAPA